MTYYVVPHGGLWLGCGEVRARRGIIYNYNIHAISVILKGTQPWLSLAV